jgi:hypothetical protein
MGSPGELRPRGYQFVVGKHGRRQTFISQDRQPSTTQISLTVRDRATNSILQINVYMCNRVPSEETEIFIEKTRSAICFEQFLRSAMTTLQTYKRRRARTRGRLDLEQTFQRRCLRWNI